MRNKLARFQQNAQRDNIIEPGKKIYESVKGQWHQIHFKNNHPLVVELACGRGEYCVGLAEHFPEKNFIGVDIKGSRIWVGSSIAIEKELYNVAFLRTKILALENFFNQDEIDEIWITFPDPRPKSSDEKRRLTHARFLEIYKRVIKTGGIVHLKTDNLGLFEYTLEQLHARNDIQDLVFTHDLYNSSFLDNHHGIKTYYERKFLAEGFKINYLRFHFK